MFNFLIDMVTDYIDWQRDAADTFAEWIMQSIDKVARPPTPVYLPKSPMTAEEVERVGRPVDASAPPKRDEFYQD